MTTISYENYLEDYRDLTPTMQRMVRRAATLELESRGVEEIGSSDVSCVVFDLYKSLGSFEAVIRHGLDLLS